MQYSFSPEKGVDCNYEQLDMEYAKLRLPLASVCQAKGDFGTIIIQEIKGDKYSIIQHHFFIKEATTLLAHCNKPEFSINYMLQGAPVISLIGLGDIIFNAGTYQMFYVPQVNQELYFKPGNHQCVQILFDPSCLRDFTIEDIKPPHPL
jgi:hypothetical protein